jgi:transposase
MELYIGIDVSLELSSVCVMDRSGAILREMKVASEPDALLAFCNSLDAPPTLVGLEAGPLSQWLYAGLKDAGVAAVLMETRHVKGALAAMPVKTDRRDAEGMAHLLRMGWFRPVHCKSASSQEARALLASRKLLVSKAVDIELGIRGVLRGFGMKIGKVSKGRFADRVRELAAGNPVLEQASEAMLQALSALRDQIAGLHRRVLATVRADEVCALLMSAPGVGPITALTYKSAIDDPTRFSSSKQVGPHFGLTPKKHQSGEKDVDGSITRAGDASVRAVLYEAASVLLTRTQSFSTLKSWGLRVAQRRGLKRATVAVARKLAVVLHRMWVEGEPFRFTEKQGAAAPA